MFLALVITYYLRHSETMEQKLKQETESTNQLKSKIEAMHEKFNHEREALLQLNSEVCLMKCLCVIQPIRRKQSLMSSSSSGIPNELQFLKQWNIE